jgi:hypothetical protein
VIFRTYLIEITHDEAFSFLLVHTNYFRAMVSTANTHWLNSFFMKLFSVIIGNEPWMLRIHSVVGFLVYVYVLYLFLQELKLLSSRIMLISLLIVNQFALEYFSLARGYGLSFSFFMLALFYAFKAISAENNEYDLHKKFLIFGFISLAANYTVFFQLWGMFLFLMYDVYKKGRGISVFRERKWKNEIILFLLASFVTVANLMLIKVINNDLRYGGDHSFFTETLGGILSQIVNGPPMKGTTQIIDVGSAVFFVLVLTVFIYGIFTKKQKIIFFSGLFFFQFTVNHIVFFLFKTPFPMLRTALALLPSIALSLVWFVEEVNWNKQVKNLTSIMVLLSMLYFFISTYSVDKAYEWQEQYCSKEIIDVINDDAKALDIVKPSVYIDKKTNAVYVNYYHPLNTENYHFKNSVYDSICFIDSNSVINFDYIIINNYSSDIPVDTNRLLLLARFDEINYSVYKTIKH